MRVLIFILTLLIRVGGRVGKELNDRVQFLIKNFGGTS